MIVLFTREENGDNIESQSTPRTRLSCYSPILVMICNQSKGLTDALHLPSSSCLTSHSNPDAISQIPDKDLADRSWNGLSWKQSQFRHPCR
jgi:hypothetical protein